MSNLNKETYNKIAKDYKEEHGQSLPWQEVLEEFASYLNEPTHIVDLGCGPGNETLWLAKRFTRCKVIGIDFSEKMVLFAREKTQYNAKFIISDIAAYQFSTSLDAIWARGSLHHLNEKELAITLENISLNLAPGGILGCVNKYGTGDATETREGYKTQVTRYFNFFNEKKIEEIASHYHLEILKQYTCDNYGTHWLVSFLKKV